MRRFFLVLLTAALVGSIGGKVALADCGTCDKTVVEVAVESKDFNTLVAAVKVPLKRPIPPKGANLSDHSQAGLNRAALLLNQRPRKTLDFMTPAEKLSEGVA